MSKQHITMEEWQLYYKNHNSASNSLRSRILNHIILCPECRTFYDHANSLADAAHAVSTASRSAYIDDGYAAVASFSQPTAGKALKNTFVVEIDADAGNAVFLDDTVETTGSARKYAVNVEGNGSRLSDDGGSFSMTLSGSTIHIHLDETLKGQVSATLRSYEHTEELSFLGCDSSATLPDDDIYILELTFS